jgi:hypothetical protein
MRTIILLLFSTLFLTQASAQKKGKSKDKESGSYEINDSLPPAPKDSKKGKSSKGKDKDKSNYDAPVNYEVPNDGPDTATRFTGIIKYRITTDDPSERDSMFVIFGENQLRIVMFTPGYRADQIFEDHYIARFSDSTLLLLDNKTKTYKAERMGGRNAGTEISLGYFKKQGQVLKFNCMEYTGDMTLPDGEAMQAACLVSKQHSSMTIRDYNFFNIQPVIVGYKIALAWRTKSTANENTYIMAYQVMPVATDSYFDISQYQLKR